MTEPYSPQSPLARLVLFMVCLALGGSIFAGIHYVALDLPAQKSVQAPTNAQWSQSSCTDCKGFCRNPNNQENYYTCIDQCELVCSS